MSGVDKWLSGVQFGGRWTRSHVEAQCILALPSKWCTNPHGVLTPMVC